MQKLERKIMIKKILMLLVLAAGLFQAGCASTRCQSAHSSAPELPKSYNKKFKVGEFRFICDPRAKQISLFASEAGKSITKDMVDNSLISAYPELFTFGDRACPIDVIVKVSETEQVFELGWYLLSLSILPGNAILTDDIKVLVRIGASEHTGHIKFNSLTRITVFSPFGLLGSTEPEVGYNGVHESHSMVFPIMLYSGIADSRKRMFLVELTEEINSIVRRMEQPE